VATHDDHSPRSITTSEHVPFRFLQVPLRFPAARPAPFKNCAKLKMLPGFCKSLSKIYNACPAFEKA